MNQVGYTGLVEGPRRWDILSGFMLTQGYKTFVEVGCKEGRTTGHILKAVSDSRVVAIDPWMKQEKSSDPTKETYEAWDFEKIEREFWENVGENKERCEMLRCRSDIAATCKLPYDFQCDMAFIDALHSYDAVLDDIAIWWPRVRKGGCLAMHDFNHRWPGVERAIADSFNLMHVGVAPDSVAFVLKHSEDQYLGCTR